MKQAKILLLDFDPASGLGSALQSVFESTASADVRLQQEPSGDWGPLFDNDGFSRVVSQSSADLLFLVLPSNFLAQARVLFPAIRRESPRLPIFVIIEASEVDEMFELLKLGAADFITPPLKAIDVLPRVWRLLEMTGQKDDLTQALKEKLGLKHLVGASPAFLAEIKKIPLVAQCDASVMIWGETGTGKELCARAVHYLSRRASGPFIPVNCGAIPLELVENELFGHERGAFTGAVTSRLGVISEADGGTLLLDEIDCLPLLAQVKLLRFLQEKEYRPLGSNKTYKADVRIIAATNTHSEQAVREGKLRQDLYYRLNVIPLSLPPLRERREDIPLLARHFLAKYATEFNRPVTGFTSEAIQTLMTYDWPGNVRELEHIVERAVVLAEQMVIRKADVLLPAHPSTPAAESFQEAKARIIEQFEKSYIQGLLLSYKGNITQAARAAQKNRRAFWQLIRKHAINVQSFKSGPL